MLVSEPRAFPTPSRTQFLLSANNGKQQISEFLYMGNPLLRDTLMQEASSFLGVQLCFATRLDDPLDGLLLK